MDKFLLYFSLIAFMLYGCSSNNNIENTKIEEEKPEELILEAKNFLKDENYDLATDLFKKIEKNFPLSIEAIESQTMIGFISYLKMDYSDAIYVYNKIIKRYPSYNQLDYVYYMRAICYYEQINDEQLDGNNNFKALENFNQVINRFPSSKYSQDSRQKIILVKQNIAAKHMDIGMYYLKNKKYLASMNRFKIVIEDYSETKFTPEALYRLVEIYYILGMKNEAINTASVISYNYPKSKWYSYSYNLVADNKDEKKFLDNIKKFFSKKNE